MKLDGIPKLYPAIPDAASERPGAAAGAPGDASAATSFASALTTALAGADDALGRAAASEHAFLSGGGGLQQMVLERAQADVALSVASAAASRTTQAISTILAMQV